jgi:hypothetical protein
MVIWESTDRGASWTKAKAITSGNARNHNYARRPLRAKDPFFAFWADGDPTALSPSHLYFGDSTGEKVWRLPYEMSAEWAEPELVEKTTN